MKPGHIALDRLAVEVEPAVAHAEMARNDPAQSGDREATLPAKGPLIADRLERAKAFRCCPLGIRPNIDLLTQWAHLPSQPRPSGSNTPNGSPEFR